MDKLNSKQLCCRLDALLGVIIQTVRLLCPPNIQKPQNEPNPIYKKSLSILNRGIQLVKMCEKTGPPNIFQKVRYASEIHQLEKKIRDFVQCQMPAQLSLELKNLISEFKSLRHLYELEAADGRNVSETILPKLTNDADENAMMLQQICPDGMFHGGFDEGSTCNCNSSGKSDFVVGMEENIVNLKRILLQREVSLVGIQGMGGVGKTTMALALCNDKEIKGAFQNNIVFITVSNSPNLKGILEAMWEKIVGRKNPEFQNVDDARRQVQQQLLRQTKQTLVVLDDVWSTENLEKLLFEGEGYKTLVTTRDRSIIRSTTSTRLYELPLLDDTDALPLFCFWAFGQKSIPSNADEQLVNQVQAECKGLPLALKVIGSSLHGQPHPAWESTKNKLLTAESISDFNREGLLRCLETSIDVLDEEARECFLDLGSFPEDKKISVDALLDIWVYVRKIERNDAFVILLELASRNLLNLTSNLSRSQTINYGSASELYFYQHDVMRDLALYLASRRSIVRRKRLLMAKKEDSLPAKWELFKDQAFDAQIVSIHTGAMKDDQWCEMNFPQAEVLVLLFSASTYILPSFLASMRKLKVLVVFNYGSKRATVNGLQALSSLTQLKTIHLEKLNVSTLQENSKVFNLEKLSLSLCEGLGNMSRFNSSQSTLKLPIMRDFNLDHCCDLEELPHGICDTSSAEKWSITSCHLLQKLPDDLGKLGSLRMLSVSACLGLKELPSSIGKLGKLEYLDISLCECLKELPEEIGQLKKLEVLDMRECSRLRKLPNSVEGMICLKHVICDENIGQQWMRVKSSAIKSLTVEVVDEQFSLDWLDV